MRNYNFLLFMAALICVGALTFTCSESNAQSVAGANAQQSSEQNQNQSNANALSNVGNSAVTFANSFNGSDIPRDLPIPSAAQVSYSGGPPMFGRPNYESNGENFISVQDMVDLLNNIDVDNVQAMDDGDINVIAQPLNMSYAADANSVASSDPDAAEEMTKPEKIRFVLNRGQNGTRSIAKNIPGFRPMSAVTLRAKDSDTMNSATLAVKLALYARSINANKIVLVSEGTVKVISSWGVGIGFNSNYATVDSDLNGTGSAGSGGTGWSWGQAEYLSLPFLVAIVGR